MHVLIIIIIVIYSADTENTAKYNYTDSNTADNLFQRLCSLYFCRLIFSMWANVV